MYSNDSEKLKVIKNAALRWKFIKGTLIAYNERSAHFQSLKQLLTSVSSWLRFNLS
jgi:hypothetical protein